MNHGKYDKSSSNSIIDRLNHWLGKLMGKKSLKNQIIYHKQHNQMPSNTKFSIIFVLMAIFLWLLTGLYYVPDASYGLIFKRGEINKVVSGMTIGVSAPYPFSSVELIDADKNIINFGQESSNSTILVTKNNMNLKVSGVIIYHVIDPKKYFINFYQETNDLDQKVEWLTVTQIQNYFLMHDSSQLLTTSNSDMLSKILETSNLFFAKYGIAIDQIKNVAISKDTTNFKMIQPLNSESSSIIIDQAYDYAKFIENRTQHITTDFNYLLPQYQANKTAITELLYYKLLSTLPKESNLMESYPLLNLTESQFILFCNNTNSTSLSEIQQSSQIGRNLNRTVDRQREFRSR